MAVGLIYEREPAVVSDRIDSIAVLPFDNLSDNQEQEYLAAGLQDAMIGSLSKIKSLRVISRKSTLRYQDSDLSFSEIARQLNVTAMIEASIIRLGDQVRIEVQLVRAFPQEDHLWSATYERDLSDVLSMLNDVAKTVASEIEISLSEGEVASLASARTINPRTYDAYLRGTYYLNLSTNESVKKGLKILHEAVANDPADPFAYAALALGYVNAGHGSPFYVDIHDPWQRAKAAAVQALKLDPNLAEAHTALAEVQGYHEWNWSGADKSFKRALELNPNLAEAHYQYGWHLTIRNRNDEAEEHMLLARELDPLVVDYTAWLGGWYWMMGRQEEAIEEVSKAFELEPNSIIGYWLLAQIYADQGDSDRSLDAYQNLQRLLNREGMKTVGAGIIYALMGRRAEAQEVLEQLDLSSEGPMMLAQLYALLGDKDGAFRQLEIAFDIPEYSAGIIRVSPAFRSLREDPRYFALLSRANLSP
jgi:TolB-like protein/Tfp pilus assembly protein PilF